MFGVAVNLEWARAHYFNDILQQVAQIAGSRGQHPSQSSTSTGRRVAGTLEPGSKQTVATRSFPCCF